MSRKNGVDMCLAAEIAIGIIRPMQRTPSHRRHTDDTSMGPPHRQTQLPTTKTMPHTPSLPTQLPAGQATMGSQTPQPPSLGMTPASRYDYNLKVLRRRDPSILSVFDQFSHVCVYHHDGKKWEKHGYEGSMFLFERESYPPYGFYIMNRMGMDDYVQPLYPEDEVVHSGNYLIIRSYQDFLNERLARIKVSHPGKEFDKFADVYAIPNIDEIDSKSKGRSSIVGLWMHTDDSRESLIEVMRKLHTYIRKNVPYPEEFRYGPGRPPPPNRLRAIPKRIAGSTSDSQAQGAHSDTENDQSYYSDAPCSANRGLSAIDKLFSKLSPCPTASDVSPQTSGIRSQSVPSITTPSTGIPLLNEIFASAIPSATPSTPPTTELPTADSSTPASVPIFAPRPSVGTLGPQILNSQVLITILTGTVPSRAPSVASTAASHPSSREGDNEEEGESDSPTTVLDEDSDCREPPQPTCETVQRTSSASHAGVFVHGVTHLGQPKINGDVTPRPPLNGLNRTLSVAEPTPMPANHYKISTPPVPDSSQKPRANRPLVPFASDSELWPYNDKPTEDSSAVDDDDGDDDGDIVELNFEDTSVLSDPDAFTRALKQKKSAVTLRRTDALNGTGHQGVNGNHSPSVFSSEKSPGKSRTRRKMRKEKEEIENGWDLPTVATARGIGMERVFGNKHSPNSSPSPIAVPDKSPPSKPLPDLKTPTMATTIPSGHNTISANVSKGTGKLVNGHAKTNGVYSPIDQEAVKDSIIHAIEAQAQPISSVDKNEFMREVVALIHTDKTFVEKLYQGYMSRRT